MALHRVLGRRLLAVAFLQYLILQAAGQRHHVGLLGILCQIFLTSLLMGLTLLRTLCLHLLLLTAEVVLYDALGIAVRHLQLVAGYHVLDGGGKIINIQISCTHLGQLLSNTETQCVTQFIHSFSKLIMYIFENRAQR